MTTQVSAATIAQGDAASRRVKTVGRGFQPRLLDDASETERRTASTSSPFVDIGERFGMGLADLYGHWKKYSLPEPVISEEYDSDWVKITVYTDSDQGTANRPKSVPKTAQGAPRDK